MRELFEKNCKNCFVVHNLFFHGPLIWQIPQFHHEGTCHDWYRRKSRERRHLNPVDGSKGYWGTCRIFFFVKEWSLVLDALFVLERSDPLVLLPTYEFSFRVARIRPLNNTLCDSFIVDSHQLCFHALGWFKPCSMKKVDIVVSNPSLKIPTPKLIASSVSTA